MKNTIFLLACAAWLTACQEPLEQRVAREVRETTESRCPMPIGNNLILDSITFDIPTLTQSQYFRLIGNDDNDSIAIKIAPEAKRVLIAELKKEPNYKLMLERGFNFHYVYRSNLNPEKVYLEILLTKEDYQ